MAIFRKTLSSLQCLHLLMDINVTSNKSSSYFDFQGPGLKVKVTVAAFRTILSSLLCLHLLMDFDITLHNCCVL